VIPWLVLLQTTLTIATSGPPTAPEYLPLWVAQGEGYFAQEQLAVSLVPTRTEPQAAEALGRGRVDLAATSLDAALTVGDTAGVPPRVVFGLTGTPAVALLVPAARKDAIKSLGDLSGSIVGIPAPGTPAEFMLLSLLIKARVPIPKITVKSYGERGLVGALESGEVTAAMIADPYATRLIDTGKAVALVDLRKRSDGERWLDGRDVYSAVFARAEARPGGASLQSLCRALLRAMARIETAAPDELQKILPAATVGFPPADFAVRLLGAREIFLTDGRVTADMLKASIELVRARGPIPAKVKLPRASRLLLNEPLEEALAVSRR
jgi:NitT/TauT family transport system substrate-binding protein